MSTSQSLIAGSNLVSFIPGVTAEERALVLRCLLYAEIGSSKAFDRTAAWKNWINSYQQLLSFSGFQRTGVLDGGPVNVSNKRGFQRESAKMIGRVRSPDLAAAAQRGLDTLFKSAHAQSFFKNWFDLNSGRSDSFQVIPCQKNASGQIHIAVCGLQMVTRTKVKLIPWGVWPLTYQMTLLLQGGTYSFDKAIYEKNKARVDRELLDARIESLKPIDL